MSRRSRRLSRQAADLAFAVPQVLAHRALRLSDQGELYRMSAEKALAFGESWSAMAIEALAANQRMALAAMQSFWFPWLPRQSAARQINEAALGVLTKGMAPVRRRAVANAKRLGRGKRRRS